MAEGHGGYRRPSNPAPVSGPGKHSRRTDGRPQQMDLPNAKYGEAQDFEQIQQGASMANPSAPGAFAAPAPTMPTGLMEPSQNPDEPITAGATVGPGPGAEALGLPNSRDEKADLIARYGRYLPMLIRKADDPSSSQEYREQVRYLIAKITG